jgi:FkbM family methyltransferase
MARTTRKKEQAKTRQKSPRPSKAKAKSEIDGPLAAEPAGEADKSASAAAPASDNGPILTNGHIALKRCRHGWFMYNRNDRFVGLSLDRYGEWCEAELAILSPLLRPGRVVLDIGAFIGSHTVFFAQKVAPTGRVYAIEPQRHAFQLLCGNAALNALTNVTALPCLAGRESGYRRLAEISQTVEGNFGATRAVMVPHGEPTRVIRIDDLDLTRCDLMKIDVEGMEADVIAGAATTIDRFKPVIYCENNRAERSSEILDAIARLGYRAWWHITSYYNPNNYFRDSENVFARYVPEANILCVPATANIVVQDLMPVSGPDDDWQKAFARLRKPGAA